MGKIKRWRESKRELKIEDFSQNKRNISPPMKIHTQIYTYIYIYEVWNKVCRIYLRWLFFIKKRKYSSSTRLRSFSNNFRNEPKRKWERKKRKKENELSRLDAILEGGLLFLWPIKKSNQISKHIHPTFHDFYPSFPERVGWKYGWKVCR